MVYFLSMMGGVYNFIAQIVTRVTKHNKNFHVALASCDEDHHDIVM